MDLSRFESMDPVMLMSIVNLKLRNDFNGDLTELAKAFDIDREILETKLQQAGFDFLPEVGQFR
ncbi:DUF4250 domain-containing protein [Reinekea marinisedimentorum]|uniref:Uncharacterized protein DUF4250 n=1 Tax=Reinekea marinisedimentorum TaxID=230495 RepID=A0A4R3IAN7_9GAMM|nr:DUF4250 domain-containing protein [Reinekea marinisedimentorum]TCS41450.1 uncharacterized protein DUF4250 [Reinekea marinisedimentorum]